MRLYLGTAQFGLDYGISNPNGKTPVSEINDILEFAYSQGIDSMDTAPAYGNSEENISAYLRSHSDQTWKIISKLPKLKNDDSIESDFDNYFCQSKHWLVDSLDTYLAQDAKQFLSNQTIRNKFYSLKERGLVNKIGVSVYTNLEIIEAIRYGGIDVIQLPLNILDHRLIKSGILKKIKEHQIEVHARSVFLQGLLFLNEKELGNKFPDVIKPISVLKNIANSLALELMDLALLFVNSIPEVDVVIIGVNNSQQLRSNLGSINKNYSIAVAQEILDKIDYNNDSVLNPVRWKN